MEKFFLRDIDPFMLEVDLVASTLRLHVFTQSYWKSKSEDSGGQFSHETNCVQFLQQYSMLSLEHCYEYP